MKLSLKNNIDFKRSDYSKGDYHQNHNNMDDEKLNTLFNDFINDSFSALFFCSKLYSKLYLSKIIF